MWTNGPLTGRVDALPDAGLWIGREAPAQVLLPLSAVSRLHVWIGVQQGQVVLVDDKSSNGTWVGGERVTRRVVQPGEVVWLARDAASFRVERGGGA